MPRIIFLANFDDGALLNTVLATTGLITTDLWRVVALIDYKRVLKVGEQWLLGLKLLGRPKYQDFFLRDFPTF